MLFIYLKTLSKLAKKNNLGKRQAKQITYFLENNYGIKANQALKIAQSKNFDEAIKISTSKNSLNQAGIIGANRDALIPQVSNRLLFTQSNNQWVRLMGQFLSWAMAKSAQTNKILTRMENGNAKTLVKTLAVLPIYSGVQSLREIAKYGEVVTDYDADNNRWWAEGARLSGMFGYLPELVANRFIGPGSREPWFLFPPAAQVASAPVEALQSLWNDDTDRAIRIVNERLLPLPNWRRNISKIFSSPLKTFKTTPTGNLSAFAMGGIVKRKRFSTGDLAEQAAREVIVPIAKPEQTEENTVISQPEVYEDKEFLNYIKKVENNPLRLGDKNNIVHESAEGGNDTVAYGHKLTDEEKKTGMIYEYDINNLNDEQMNDILIRDLEKAELELLNNYPEEYTSLDKTKKQMLIDFQFNGGAGMVDKFEKFRDGLFTGNNSKIKTEYKRGYTDKNKNFKELVERNKDFANFFFNKLDKDKLERVEKNLGGIIGKAIAKKISKDVVKRGDTAISTTIGTYKKINNIFNDNKVKTVHDFGSGLGLGSKEFTNKIVTNHEPFVPLERIIKAKGKVPNYKTADDVIFKEGFASKDGVVNANVLNVIEDPMERSNVVRQISQLISNKGMAVITTRGSEVTKAAQTSKNAVPFNDGWIFGKGDKKTFQKGYSQKELEEYIKSILGDKFSVVKIPSKYKVSSSGVIIKKIKGDK